MGALYLLHLNNRSVLGGRPQNSATSEEEGQGQPQEG